MEEIKVEQAELRDIDQLIPLWKEIMKYHVDDHHTFDVDTSQDNLIYSHLNNSIFRGGMAIFKAVHEEKIVGMIITRVERLDPIRKEDYMGYIAECVVSEDYRCMGIGAMMVAKVKEWLKANRADYINLQVSVKNLRALKFWEEQGFSPLTTTLSMKL